MCCVQLTADLAAEQKQNFVPLSFLDFSYWRFMLLESAMMRTARNDNVPVDSNSPFLVAASLGDATKLTSVKSAWRVKDENGDNALHYAIMLDNLSCVQFIMDTYEDLAFLRNNNLETPILLACKLQRSIAIISLLLQAQNAHQMLELPDKKDLTPLQLLCSTNNKDMSQDHRLAVSRLLLTKTPNVNRHGRNARTALHDAIEYGHLNIIKALLDQGAHVLPMDALGNNAMSHAAIVGSVPIIDLLLRYFPKCVDLMDSTERTPLMIAAAQGHSRLIPVLLAAGANPVARGKHGNTALGEAIGKNSADTVKELLKDEKVRDLSNYSSCAFHPLFHALKYGSSKILQLMIDAGFGDHSITDIGYINIMGRDCVKMGAIPFMLSRTDCPLSEDTEKRLKILLKAGFPVNYPKSHFPALVALVQFAKNLKRKLKIVANIEIDATVMRMFHTLVDHGADIYDMSMYEYILEWHRYIHSSAMHMRELTKLPDVLYMATLIQYKPIFLHLLQFWPHPPITLMELSYYDHVGLNKWAPFLAEQGFPHGSDVGKKIYDIAMDIKRNEALNVCEIIRTLVFPETLCKLARLQVRSLYGQLAVKSRTDLPFELSRLPIPPKIKEYLLYKTDL